MKFSFSLILGLAVGLDFELLSGLAVEFVVDFFSTCEAPSDLFCALYENEIQQINKKKI
jgi:hypothetical protein